MATEVIRTEHPHVVRVPGVCGGRPVIAGTRMSVDFIARFIHDGVSLQEILELYPHLTPAALHDAVSYYYDHQSEIDAEIRDNTPEALAQKYNFRIAADGRIIFGDV